jgi:hypothetical protein
MPCITKDIRGFPGSKITAEDHSDFGIDDDVAD